MNDSDHALWQGIIRDYLKTNGVQTTKYLKYLRMPLMCGYVNILPCSKGIGLVFGSMKSRQGWLIKGDIADPNGKCLENLLRFCLKCRELTAVMYQVCDVSKDNYTIQLPD